MKKKAVHFSSILVVYKKSFFQEQSSSDQNREFLQYVKSRTEAEAEQILTAHSEHYTTLDAIVSILNNKTIDYSLCERSDLDTLDEPYRFDLIIAVGGDGTALASAKYAHKAILLAVNSSPSASVGRLCGATKETFEGQLDRLLSGNLNPTRLRRLRMYINDQKIDDAALNEVLVAHEHPAALSKLQIHLGNQSEVQRHSGIWVATPSGSTGAIHSAGGAILPLTSNRFQYLVREPFTYSRSPISLATGYLNSNQELALTSLMNNGLIAIDGYARCHSFSYGDKIRIDNNGTVLKLVL